ncbi:MAG: flagellar basal-body rod protein FlgF [Acidobacteriaceae bacterium]|nr:flagellar basal-body rod protein FlgF [Acidobacteriaceae bacterium]
MNSGYYAACAGLEAQSRALDLVANNLANLNTSGFRAQQSLFRSFLADPSAAVEDPLNRAINNYSVLGGSRIDLSSGNLQRTGNSLDLAIEGSGFFAVQTHAGVVYTRDGNFQISAAGRLVTRAGDLVLGEQGPISIPSGVISISPDGTLSADGAVVDKMRVLQFATGSEPISIGESYYSIPKDQVRPATDSYVRQGTLESSNVNAMTAMVELITIQRKAEMLERAMSAFQSNLDHIAANDLPHV